MAPTAKVLHHILIVTCVIYSVIGITGASQDDTLTSKGGSNYLNENGNFDKIEGSLRKSVPRDKPSYRLIQLINWLFGPPAPSHKLRAEDDGQWKESKSNFPAFAVEGNSTTLKNSNDKTNGGAKNLSQSQGSEKRVRTKREVEIVDIQASIGTEVDASKLSDDPSQVNLKDELETVEAFEKQQQRIPRSKNKLSRKSGLLQSRRQKREPYKPVKVPYITTPAPNQQFNNMFQKRQLLMNPMDPQHQAIMVLQQQQAAAAAAALIHRQQMDTILNGGSRISSLVDDYDDRDEDDDSDESEEFDDFSKYGLHNPMEHHHMGPFFRDGLHPHIPPPHPFQRKVGWGLGRRSLTEKEKKGQTKGRTELITQGRNRGAKPNRFSKLKSGKWFLDDYDLNSEFYDHPHLRKNIPEHLLDTSEEIIELDEEEHHERHNQDQSSNEEIHSNSNNQDHLNYRGDTDYIYREFKDSLCEGNECLQSRQMTSTTTGGGSSGTTGGSSTTSGSGNSAAGTSTTTTRSTTTRRPTPPYSATLNCRCGTQSVRGEGIGEGIVIRFNVNPWLVAISNSSGHMCSGSIINDRFILTSKQCVRNATAESLKVTAGLTAKHVVNFTVARITLNPIVNIALLQLNSTITPSHRMRPVCLPIGRRYAGQYSTGMIITFKKGPPPTVLQMVDTEVAIMNGSNCGTSMPGTFCAGPPGSIKCGGDTGGLFMVYRGGYSYEQIGVISGTVGCRATRMPGVYTDIRKRTRWILNNSRLGNYCKSPRVTSADLMSSTRHGDPHFELNDDGGSYEDEFLAGHLDNDDYGFEDFENSAEEEEHFRTKNDGEDVFNTSSSEEREVVEE